jgi:hypothetical protein
MVHDGPSQTVMVGQNHRVAGCGGHGGVGASVFQRLDNIQRDEQFVLNNED